MNAKSRNQKRQQLKSESDVPEGFLILKIKKDLDRAVTCRCSCCQVGNCWSDALESSSNRIGGSKIMFGNSSTSEWPCMVTVSATQEHSCNIAELHLADYPPRNFCITARDGPDVRVCIHGPLSSTTSDRTPGDSTFFENRKKEGIMIIMATGVDIVEIFEEAGGCAEVEVDGANANSFGHKHSYQTPCSRLGARGRTCSGARCLRSVAMLPLQST